MYPPMSNKPQTNAKHPLCMNRAGPKKCFVPKRIQTLNLMEIPPRPRPYHLSQSLGVTQIILITKKQMSAFERKVKEISPFHTSLLLVCLMLLQKDPQSKPCHCQNVLISIYKDGAKSPNT